MSLVLKATGLVRWALLHTNPAQKDAKNLAAAGLKEKAQQLFELLKNDPLQHLPPFEKLVGDLTGSYSRRINIQHRLVYHVLVNEKQVKILRMWSHYE
ncbi:Txe/YoeB family addiction module toxin [Methylomonas paludis]|uniref:Txe/YoeB family addiction module toxin n=1 Tax=Methylomonas paludis TaxID=1173101 RepID=UPI001FE2EE4B|nr:Txe/YoeB family addiction module toxin [Methylomonas paludis]